MGTALGIGTAAYEFERADDLNLIAKTGDAGGNQLLTQPDKAKQDYLLGWANLVLAGIDGGLAIKEGAQVLNSLKAAEKLATRPGASAIFTIPQDKVLQIQRALDLERAGDPTAASTLFALRKELGGKSFDGVYDTLEDGNLRVIDNAEAAKFKGRGLDDNQLPPLGEKSRKIRENLTPKAQAEFDKMRRQYETDEDFIVAIESEDFGDPTRRFEARARSVIEKAEKAAAAQKRINNAQSKLDAVGFFGRADIVKELDKAEPDLATIRGKIAAELAKQEAVEKFPVEQGYIVKEEINVVEQVPGYSTHEQWVADNPGKNKDTVYELDGKVWIRRGDIDLAVTRPSPDSGRSQIVRLEEIKSGKKDKPSKARGQLDKVQGLLERIENGDTTVRLHPNRDTDVTDQFDLSNSASIQTVTKGPDGKAFDETLPLTATEINTIAQKAIGKRKN